MTNRIGSEIRGAGLLGPHASLEYRALVAGQPLILVREPSNPRDSNAVIAKTLLLVPCGYIAKEHAALIAPDMDRDVLWLCKVTAARGVRSYPQCILWKEDRNAAKFRKYMLAYGADPRIVECIIAKKFITEDAS